MRTVQDGQRVLRFAGDVLAAASSQRPGAVRWSELVVYRLANGTFLVSRVGRSVLAHRPNCLQARANMPTWLEAGAEGRVHREACPECQPVVGDGMDPQTLLEVSRYSVLQVSDQEKLHAVLTGGNKYQARIIADVLTQLTKFGITFSTTGEVATP